MKTINYFLKLSTLVALVFGLSQVAMAAPDIYLTSKGSVTLKFISADGYNLAPGDKVLWQKFESNGDPVSGTENEKEFTSDLADVSLVLTATEAAALSLGSHFYRAAVTTADPAACAGDVSEHVEIYRLPDLAISLAVGTDAYCESVTGSSIITATTTTEGHTLPSGVQLDYAWTAEKDEVAVDPVTGLGTPSHTASTADLSTTFTVNVAAKGKYDFKASVKYPALAGAITIKGASQVLSTEGTVTVTPKPGKPVISVD